MRLFGCVGWLFWRWAQWLWLGVNPPQLADTLHRERLRVVEGLLTGVVLLSLCFKPTIFL